jgi:hypothetical protein
MVVIVEMTSTYAISVIHHLNLEFESRQGRGALDITTLNNVCQ